MTARVWTGVALVWVALFAYSLTLPAAEASQPYGGCEEAWQAPHSAGADQCRSHGWTVRSRMVLDPRNRVHALVGLAECRTEDQRSACYWKAECRGNGRGDSFVRLNGREWFVSFGWAPCGNG